MTMTETIKEMRSDQAERPIVLLDVDGVVNWDGPGRIPKDLKKVLAGGWMVWLVPETVEAVKLLAASVDLRWCTAWREAANEYLLDHLGISPLPVIKDVRSARGADWKYEEVRALLNREERRVVWIEDFMGSWLNPGTPSLLVDEFGDRITLIDTTMEGCLRMSHLEGVL